MIQNKTFVKTKVLSRKKMFQKYINVICCILPLLSISWCHSWLPILRNSEEAKGSKLYVLDFISLVGKIGYNVDHHIITTEDGYILDLFRILSNNSSHKRLQSGPPVLMQHGLFGSAEEMILIGEEKNFVYVLSNAGYDVWLGNLRGNYHGRKHQRWSPNESRFWDFSLDEWALKDTPAMIDYILKTTGRSKLTYMGISLSATLNVMLLAHRADFNEKVNLSVLFSPILFWKRPSKNLARAMTHLACDLLQGLESEGAFEILTPTPFFYLAVNSCAYNTLTLRLCILMNGFLLGDNGDQWYHLTPEQVRSVGLYLPAGLSLKPLFHYAQQIRTGELQFYDYGDDAINLRYYGQKQVPNYNVSNIFTPLVIFRGGNDVLVLPEDIQNFFQKLPTTTTVIHEEVKDFTHVDFLMAKDAKKLVHDKLLKILLKFVEFP